MANAKAEEMAGFGRGELIGETDEAFMDPAAVSAARQGDDRTLGGAPPRLGRRCLRRIARRSRLPIGHADQRSSRVDRGGGDTQFDPRIVDLLLGHVDEAISIRT